jgi:hypothetical protein
MCFQIMQHQVVISRWIRSFILSLGWLILVPAASWAQVQGLVISPVGEIRQRADRNSLTIRRLSTGQSLTVLGDQIGADGWTWYEVGLDGVTGWLRGDSLRLNQGNTSLVTFITPNYVVRVFRRGEQVFANVFQKNTRTTIFSSLAMNETTVSDGTTYVDRDGLVEVTINNRGERSITFNYTITEYALDNPTATAIDTTLFAFQTTNYAVRILRREGQLALNIYNKRENFTWLNGVPLEQEVTPIGNYYHYRGEVRIRIFQGLNGDRWLQIGNDVPELAQSPN